MKYSALPSLECLGVTLIARFAPCCLAFLLLAAAASAQDRSCFVRPGDVWVFVGDSITHNDTYRRMVERVYRHYNPGANVRFPQAGRDGAPSSASKEQLAKATEANRPTLISLMTGMNDSINSGWRLGLPMDQPLEGYRKQIDGFAEAAAEGGVDAVLLSPTLTDESLGWSSMWATEGTSEFLRKCGLIVKDVSSATKAFYIPAQEEFEAAQKLAPAHQVFRADAVHPTAMGQYRIAGALIRRMAFDAPVSSGPRKLSAPAEELPVQIALGARMLSESSNTIPLEITTFAPATVTATYTFRNKGLDSMARKSIQWQLTGKDSVGLELPAGALGLEMGKAADVILDITDGRRRSLYVIDLCRVPVLHLTGNKVSGVIVGDATRAEGKKAAEWTLSVVDGKWLSLDVEVVDSQICPENIWPWGQDGLTVWMDYRPATRFADIGVDADVYQAFLLPYEKPTFAVSLRPWLGRAVWGPAVAGGVKTATGYKVHLHVADQQGQFHRFSRLADSDLSLRDFFAFDLVLCDQDRTVDGKATSAVMPYARTEYPHDKYANNLVIIDLKDKLKGGSVVNLHLTKL